MKKDATRVTVEKTLTQIKRVKKLMGEKFAFGPDSVKLDRREARKMIQNMSPEQYDTFFSSLGRDKWDVMMQDLYRG